MKARFIEELAVILHPDDDVAITRALVPAGTLLQDAEVTYTARKDIPLGHKIARRAREQGEPVRRYGQVIGVATALILAGEHVHVHNLAAESRAIPSGSGVEAQSLRPAPPEDIQRFTGFLRSDGRVGTRNYIAIISTVNCSASVCKAVSERFRDAARNYPGIDGVIALTHKSGCAMSVGSENYEALMRVLTGYARHPNVGGCAIIGLGCETHNVAALRARGGLENAPAFVIQELGGTRATIEAVTAAVRKLLPVASQARRASRPVSELVLATNCGGSDGRSGITANPALGWAVDELVRHGGTAVLAETPEICGAEHLLIRRAKSREVAEKLIERIRWWDRYCGHFGAGMDSNPSPGNIAGGITTIFEKSLGAITKGGTSPLVDVFNYAERIAGPGLVFMDTPGFDPVSVTGLVAGGATIVAFTTGCGSVFGSALGPSVKLAATSALFKRMPDDMDIDCGSILDGVPISNVGRQIFEELIMVASGKRTKSEEQGIGEEEFAPWVIGPVM
jgi:altronate hydrolase